MRQLVDGAKEESHHWCGAGCRPLPPLPRWFVTLHHDSSSFVLICFLLFFVSLLLLSEPTSGLDSQAAAKVMDVVRRIAKTGRAVICTIHQPSSSIFTYTLLTSPLLSLLSLFPPFFLSSFLFFDIRRYFDHLLLLKKGGSTVYFGPTSEDCRSMFEYFAHILIYTHKNKTNNKNQIK